MKALPLFLLLSLPLSLAAEDVRIPVGQQGAGRQIATPSHGMTQAAVIARFGQPLETHAPVGNPPIIIWHYAEFTVYFEGNKVIHAVVNPPAPTSEQAEPAEPAPQTGNGDGSHG